MVVEEIVAFEIAKIMDVGNVFGFLGRGGQADLRGR